jgi:hypothetical protein
MRICDVDGCDRKHLARGFCDLHYRRVLNAGTTDPSDKRLAWEVKVCSVDGCDRKHDAHGLCHMHSRRLKVTGTLEQRKSINKGKKCSVDGCDSDAKQTGKCRMHYARFYKNGTTNRSEKRKDWRGTKVFSSDGEEQTITISVRAFCKERGLIEQNMRKVLTGDREHCGGWTFPESGFVRSPNGGGRNKVPYRACSVDGCEIDSKTKDLCEKHRQSLKRFGRTHTIKRAPGDAAPNSKKCARCGDTKPIARFSTMGVYADGFTIKHNTRCKACSSAEANEYHHANRERKLKEMRKRREQLNDTYVKTVLGVKNATPELMDAKRVQLRITRHLREMVKTPANI